MAYCAWRVGIVHGVRYVTCMCTGYGVLGIESMGYAEYTV